MSQSPGPIGDSLLSPLDVLSERELEVLRLVATGLSNRQIAAELFLALGTVKTHIHNIFSKLDVLSRTQAIARSQELGLLKGIPLERRLPENDLEVENPYKGLRAFQEEDTADFFGREALVERLLARLNDDHALARFLAVVGPSGSGKSSVIKAGVIPALRSTMPHWQMISMLPGTYPLEELEITLSQINTRDDLHAQLTRDARGLLRATRLVLPDNTRELLLIVDQFEELFTLTTDPAQARHFMDLIYVATTDPRSQVRVVIALRADFYDRPLMYPDFSELVRQRTEVVVPLTPDELERAIVGPIERLDIEAEPGLVAAVVADVNEQPGALPMLQYALTDLFDHRTNGVITLDTYRRLGGITQALARRADEVYEILNERQQAATRQLFLRLVSLGEGTEDTRRRVLRSELLSIGGAEMPLALDAFGESRLLTFDTSATTHAPTVEVAHEAIIREWGRLRVWLDESRDDIRQQRLLEAAAVEWRSADRDSGYLLSSSRLEQFVEWAAHTPLELTPDEQDYLNSSVAERERQRQFEIARQARERALERRARRVLQGLVAVFLLAALIGAALSLFALDREHQAQDARATSEANAAESQSLYLAGEAEKVLNGGDTDLALALILEAVRLDPASEVARRVLVSVASVGGTRQRFAGHTAQVLAVAFSPDGRQILSGSHDGTAILWDAATGAVLQRLGTTRTAAAGRPFAVLSVAISPDGHTALLARFDTQNTFSLWNLETGEEIRRFTGHMNTVISVAFSPDGRTALSGSLDKTVMLWDVATGSPLHRLVGHTDILVKVAFSPDGRTAFSGADDGQVIQWDVATGQEIHRFAGPAYFKAISPDGHTALFRSQEELILWDVGQWREIRRFEQGFDEGNLLRGNYKFSPDGHTILSSSDRTVILWDAATGQEIRRFVGHTSPVQDVAFSPDGRTLISGSGVLTGLADNSLRLWDIVSGSEIRRFDGIGSWSPDGQTLLLAPFVLDIYTHSIFADLNALVVDDLRLVDLRTVQELRRLPLPPGTVPGRSVFSPDGRTLMLNLYDAESKMGQLVLWEAESEALAWGVGPVLNRVYTITFSPDSRIVLGGEIDFVYQDPRVIHVWDVDSGSEIGRWQGPIGGIASLAVSPNQRTALSGGWDNIIRLWNVDTGQEIRQFVGHAADAKALVFSSDGLMALSGGDDRTLLLWNVDETSPALGAIIRQFTGHESGVSALAFSPDDALAVSGDYSGSLLLWNVATGELIHYFVGHTSAIVNVQFMDEGRTILSSAHDGTTRLWQVPPYRTLDELLAWLPNNRYIPEFTCEQRAQYRITPLCAEAGVMPPTRTPFPTLTPSATPTLTPTPNLTVITATPTFMPSVTPSLTPTIPTATPTPTFTPSFTPTAAVHGALVSGVAVNGLIAPNQHQTWTFAGHEGQTITLLLSANDGKVTLLASDGQILLESGSGRSDPVILPVTGIYTIQLDAEAMGGLFSLTLIVK